MAGWDTLENMLREEIKQRGEEGCNVAGFAEKLAQSPKDKASLDALYDALMALPLEADFPYDEPSDWAGIQAALPKTAPFAAKAIDRDRFRGAWLGRSCGCALGKPVEAGDFMNGKNGMPGWQCVHEWFKGADAYPIKGYTPTHSRAEETLGLSLTQWSMKSTKEQIRFMESDDDIRYTVLGLMLLEESGLEWNSLAVGNLWSSHLTINAACTAERQAYINYQQIRDVPLNTDEEQAAFIDWVRTYRNPYREWIGAQIRVDAYAYAAAGNPALAAELAWRDSAFSHVKNGIYGAMFIAAMIAAAFVESDNMKIVEAGLAQLPANCRLTHAIREAIAITAGAKDELDLVAKLWDAFGHYSSVHTINNAALCVAAILFAGDDYEKAITTAVLGGWDTDCNGATVGSIMGAKLGTGAIPAYWSAPLNDTLYSAIPDFHPIAISTCADKSYDLYKKFRDQ